MGHGNMQKETEKTTIYYYFQWFRDSSTEPESMYLVFFRTYQVSNAMLKALVT